MLIGCLISVISAGRHTGTGTGASGYQIDEREYPTHYHYKTCKVQVIISWSFAFAAITIGESLLRPPESTEYIATLFVTRTIPLRRGRDHFREDAATTAPPPDYEEAMRTGPQPPNYTPNG